MKSVLFYIKCIFLALLTVSLISNPLISSSHQSLTSFSTYEDISSDTVICYMYNVTGCYVVQAPEPNLGPFKLYVHFPISFGKQAPFIFNLREDPNGKVLDYKIKENYPGPNALLEIYFDNLEDTYPVYIYWSMVLLMEYNDYSYLPEHVDIANEEDLPEEISVWLESSQFIQSDEPEIIDKLGELIGNDNNSITIAKTIGNFTGVEIDYDYATYQDALSTLQRGYGVCTGKSNLAAALFRAAGIPARILLTSPLPHFFVEYYVHPYGWVRSEATVGTTPISYHWFVTAYCAYPEDETDSSYINGQYPGYGAVVYWGADNKEIFWDIVNSNCHRDSYNIEMTQEQKSKAYNLSNSVWEEFITNFNRDLSEKEKQSFIELRSYQSAAAQAFVQKNLQGFFENLESALEGYQSGLEKSGISFEFYILSIIITVIFLIYRKKKKN